MSRGVQSGDPSIYGAVLEQMRLLESAGVDYEIVPGVSAAFAAAAVLKTEFTVPEVSQTVIFTRLEGRVAMPSGEKLRDLAAHGCTLVLFLSITRINKVVSELKAGGAYNDDTPVAVVYRVGWEDELVITGTLGDIAPKVKRAGHNAASAGAGGRGVRHGNTAAPSGRHGGDIASVFVQLHALVSSRRRFRQKRRELTWMDRICPCEADRGRKKYPLRLDGFTEVDRNIHPLPL